ncbi:hypothetical protein AMECASPLE_017697 [Ameca splendens]|uniref:Secreted protein n=1 Tax=Ameca splendens TaxID=208324 RepID=A0ABV0Y2E7_9TELE
MTFCGSQSFLFENCLYIHLLTHLLCICLCFRKSSATVYCYAYDCANKGPVGSDLLSQRLGLYSHHRTCSSFLHFQKSFSDLPCLVPHFLNAFYSVLPPGL